MRYGGEMNKHNRKHKWEICGWTEHGRKPQADEWECVHCGLTVVDGEKTDSIYCEVEP